MTCAVIVPGEAIHYIAAVTDDFDSLLTPIAWTDAHGAITQVNAAFAHWLGVGARRLRGIALPALEAGDAVVERALALPRQAPLQLRRVGLAFADQAPRFADLWLCPLPDGWRLEAHPVAEFPGPEPAIALPLALSAAFKGLAHELRNPLAGLKGAAQLLARRIDGQDSLELIDLIDSEVERLSALLERLLAPQPAQPHAPLNIHAVLERVLRLAAHDAGWAARLVRDYDPSLPELNGNADRLTQAVWNLVRNALQAGASVVTLRTRAEHALRIGERQHALALRLEVVDDGHGVADDLSEHLFLPLVGSRADGSGLGLALAQQVAREHGGALGYRSRPGHTVFTLLMPIATERPQ